MTLEDSNLENEGAVSQASDITEQENTNICTFVWKEKLDKRNVYNINDLVNENRNLKSEMQVLVYKTHA